MSKKPKTTVAKIVGKYICSNCGLRRDYEDHIVLRVTYRGYYSTATLCEDCADALAEDIKHIVWN